MKHSFEKILPDVLELGANLNAVTQAGQKVTEKDPVSSEALALLSEFAFLATIHGYGAKVLPIFDLLKVCFPQSAVATIGYAINASVMGRVNEAIALLIKEGIQAKVASDQAKAVLMILLTISGKSEEAKIFRRMLIGNRSMAVREACKMMEKILQNKTRFVNTKGNPNGS